MKKMFFLLMAVLLCDTAISQTSTVMRLDVDVGHEFTFNKESITHSTFSIDAPVTVTYTPAKSHQVYMFEPVSKSDPFSDAIKMGQTNVLYEMNNRQMLNTNKQQKNPNSGYSFVNEDLTRLDIGEFTW